MNNTEIFVKELEAMTKKLEAMKRTLIAPVLKEDTVEERLAILEKAVLKVNQRQTDGNLKDRIQVLLKDKSQSFADIARQVGCTRAYVQLVAKGRGIYRPKTYTKELMNKVEASLNITHSGTKTAKDLGLSPQTVYAIKRRLGVEYIPKRKKKKPIKYTKEVMIDAWNKNHNYSKMAEELDTFPSTVSRVMKGLKLRKQYPPVSHELH